MTLNLSYNIMLHIANKITLKRMLTILKR